MAQIILFNKPFRVLSQFSDTEGRPTLAHFLQAPGFRAAGRLDFDSEGLIILCNDGMLQQQIANPRFKAPKTYLVQVEGDIDSAALERLRRGVALRDGMTLPAEARRIDAPQLWPRVPPVRHRLSVADSWLELIIREGRNRQVRRMTAAVGFPTLRLVRTQIGDWPLGPIASGSHRRMEVAAASSAHNRTQKTRGQPPSGQRRR